MTMYDVIFNDSIIVNTSNYICDGIDVTQYEVICDGVSFTMTKHNGVWVYIHRN